MDEKRIFLARHGQTFHNAAAGESYIDADYLDGELAGDDRERAEAHVGLCPECRRVVAGPWERRDGTDAMDCGSACRDGHGAGGDVSSVSTRAVP